VTQRYQNAAELGADLGRLLEGYRFDPKELRQFMRQMFRKEYAKEVQDTSTALSSLPLGEQPPEPPQPVVAEVAPQPPAQPPAQPSPTAGNHDVPTPPNPTPSQPDAAEEQPKRGFWSKLGFGRKR
jgi:hypothetical protein